MTEHRLQSHIDHYLGKHRSLLLVRRNKLPYGNCDDCYGKSDVAHRNSCPCLKNHGMCHGFHASSTDPEVLDGWLNKKKTAVGLAQATGKPSGVFVVDVDEGGVEELQELIRAHGGIWPETEVHLSHKGLPHFVFEMPLDGTDVRNHIKKLSPNTDIKGTGGYDILPPSQGAKGQYRIQWDRPPIQAPQWLLDKITSWQIKPERRISTFDIGNMSPEIPPMVKKAVTAWVQWIITSPDGQQNGRIFVASRKMFSLVEHGLMGESEADSILLEACIDGNHPDHRALITIDSGSRSAKAEPYTVRELLGPTKQERATEFLKAGLTFFKEEK